MEGTTKGIEQHAQPSDQTGFRNLSGHRQLGQVVFSNPFGLKWWCFFCWITLMTCAFTCHLKQKRNIKEYYFPLDNLRIGKIYEYQSLLDSTQREYWYYKVFERDSGTILVSTAYNIGFQIEQVVTEKIVENGVLAKNLYLYEYNPDTTLDERQKQITAVIEASNAFPFEVSDTTGIFLYKLYYSLPATPNEKIYLIRNRQFAGDDSTFAFKNLTYPTIRFHLREILGHEGEGNAEGRAEGHEWYAKGIGLVHYKKSYGSTGHFVRDFKLVDIYPMREFERRAKAFLLPAEKQTTPEGIEEE